jgi:hypothetical protein
MGVLKHKTEGIIKMWRFSKNLRRLRKSQKVSIKKLFNKKSKKIQCNTNLENLKCIKYKINVSKKDLKYYG